MSTGIEGDFGGETDFVVDGRFDTSLVALTDIAWISADIDWIVASGSVLPCTVFATLASLVEFFCFTFFWSGGKVKKLALRLGMR